MADEVRRPGAPLTRNVKALSLVSLLTDASSEMILPLLPLFVTTVLGASATMLGAIEGLADSISALLKLASGWWSDRVRRRKPIVVAGYGIASVARPLMAFAAHPWHVMAVRAADRVGKGIRSSPRDALIADATPPADRGRAYGFHRAADNFGAVVGPVAAWLLMEQGKMELRTVFLWASLPAVLSLVVLAIFVRDVDRPGAPADAAKTPAPVAAPGTAALGSGFWRYLAVVFVFTIGCSTDAFLLLRASQIGVAAAWIPILWAGHNLVRAFTSTPGGHLSDHVGRKPLIVAGWAVYAAVYLLFAFATEAWQAWVVLLAYGLYFGLVEGAEKAFVADLVPAERRGAAFGWFNFVVGVGALPASLIFGLVWDRVSPVAAFGLSASLAGAASTGLLLLVPRSPTQQQR